MRKWDAVLYREDGVDLLEIVHGEREVECEADSIDDALAQFKQMLSFTGDERIISIEQREER